MILEPPYPWDAPLERIKAIPERDEDKSDWINAHLELRFWMRFLSLYSDLSKHGGVELDPATGLAKVVRYKPEDIRDAKQDGHYRQLHAAVAQIHGEELAALLPPAKGKRGGIPNPKLDEGERDYYYVRDLLRRKYLGPDEKQFYRWRKDALAVIADFHGVDEDTLDRRLKR